MYSNLPGHILVFICRLMFLLTLSLPSSTRTFSEPFKEQCIREVVRSGSIIILHPSKAMKSHTMWCNITSEAAGEIWNWSLLGVKGLKPWPNGPPSSSQIEPRSQRRWSVSFGHPLGLSWLELNRVTLNLIKLKFSPNSSHIFHRFDSSANSSQLSPSCFVIVMWLRGRIQTIERFLAGLFPNFGPPSSPYTMLLQGGYFERNDSTLYGGRGEGMVELSKSQVYHDFWPGLKLARLGGIVWPPADASYDFVWLELAWVGSIFWPGL